jgi:hypothetical protein
MRAYVLIGYPKDTFALAEQRLQQMLTIGFTPYAMLWRPETPSQQKYAPEESWRAFQRLWARPALIHAREVVPYGKSPTARARVKAARAAQRLNAQTPDLLAPHRPKKGSDNADVATVSGNRGSEYALARLRRDRPDIHARVLAGELSPHAGMVEAGFRRRAAAR